MAISPKHISYIVQLLAKTSDQSFIRVLCTLTVVGDLPLKRNQILIIKALLQHPESVACVLESTSSSRLELLKHTEIDVSTVEGRESDADERHCSNYRNIL